jgi:PPK2 family polyphosphate:nucleotide phosphotransferase
MASGWGVGDSRAAMGKLAFPRVKKKLHQKVVALEKPYRVIGGGGFSLGKWPTNDTGGLEGNAETDKLLAHGVHLMSDLQERLYADDKWAVLLVFQAMDAAGKDGTIKHVMSGINPAGCQVTSFKQPSQLELDHDYLWRAGLALPQRGRIGIFNRSYYEETLVARVHREVLKAEKIPAPLTRKRLWKERFADIRAFERHLARNGTIVLKFFLHLSKAEQKKRFLARLDEPAKNWKFSAADLKERERWDDYQDAYEEMIGATATPHAPWYIVPADNKWFAHLVVAGAVVKALDRLDLQFPKITREQRDALVKARRKLEG